MSSLVALSISIGVIGAIWAFFCLGPLSPYLLVWAGFIAWGCFFHTGGDARALTRTIASTIYGAVLGWIALLIVVYVPIPPLGAVWPAIVVGVTVWGLVIIASVELLSTVPANVYGYAAIVAYSLSAASKAPASGPLFNLTSGSFANPLILLIVSMVIGACLGYISGQVAKSLTKTSTAAAE